MTTDADTPTAAPANPWRVTHTWLEDHPEERQVTYAQVLTFATGPDAHAAASRLRHRGRAAEVTIERFNQRTRRWGQEES